MKTQAFGKTPLVTTRLAYGCWRLAGADDPRDVTEEKRVAGRRAVAAAFEAGYTHFDNADIYCRGVCETLLGESLRQIPDMREKVIIATKCGIRFAGDPTPDLPHRFDFSAEHIVRSCEGSLRRLGIETIDLYMLHRPDALMNPAEVAGAFDRLLTQGKVRHVGVSNFSPSFVSLLSAFCPMPLAVNQVEISLGRLDCLHDGTLDQCIERNISAVAWSPLAGGWIATGNVGADDPKGATKRGVLAALDEVAARRGATRTVIALAWLLKHPAKIVPIIGSVNVHNIRAAAQADEIDLSREEWYRLYVAARGEPLP